MPSTGEELRSRWLDSPPVKSCKASAESRDSWHGSNRGSVTPSIGPGSEWVARCRSPVLPSANSTALTCSKARKQLQPPFPPKKGQLISVQTRDVSLAFSPGRNNTFVRPPAILARHRRPTIARRRSRRGFIERVGTDDTHPKPIRSSRLGGYVAKHDGWDSRPGAPAFCIQPSATEQPAGQPAIPRRRANHYRFLAAESGARWERSGSQRDTRQ